MLDISLEKIISEGKILEAVNCEVSLLCGNCRADLWVKACFNLGQEFQSCARALVQFVNKIHKERSDYGSIF